MQSISKIGATRNCEMSTSTLLKLFQRLTVNCSACAGTKCELKIMCSSFFNADDLVFYVLLLNNDWNIEYRVLILDIQYYIIDQSWNFSINGKIKDSLYSLGYLYFILCFNHSLFIYFLCGVNNFVYSWSLQGIFCCELTECGGWSAWWFKKRCCSDNRMPNSH